MDRILQRMGGARLDYLDQVRALAIVTVIFNHFHSGWVPGGGMGVGIFFALSGFLIATILLEEKKFTPATAAKFVIRRVMRIYPAYFTAIMATVILTYLNSPEKLSAVMRAASALLIFRTTDQWLGYGFGVLWTLQVEMAFYLTMPLAMLCFGQRRGLLIVAIVLIVLSGWAFFVPPFWPLQRWGAALAFGSLLSLAWKRGLLENISGSPIILITISLSAIVFLLFIPPLSLPIWAVEILVASLCGCGLITAFLLCPSLPVVPGAAWIGRISYSIYLIHGIILDFQIWSDVDERVLWKFHRWEIWKFRHLLITPVSFITVVVGFSALSYYLVEKPGIRLGKFLTASRPRHAIGGQA